GDQTKNFPALGADQFDNRLPYASAEHNFVGAVDRAQTRESKQLALEIYNPNCFECANAGYWARYYSKEAGDGEGGGPPPPLVITYTAGSVAQAVPNGSNTVAVSRVVGQPNTGFTLHFLGAESCPDGVLPAEGATNIGPVDVTTDNTGNVYSTESLPTTAPFL